MITPCRYSDGLRATGWTAGVLSPAVARFFSSPQRPDGLLSPTQPAIQRVPGLFARGYSGWCVKMTTHPNLVPRSRMVELYLHSLKSLHGVIFALEDYI
jgi:hypothetical protein